MSRQPESGGVLGLVPARAGSKRLPGKNLADLGGRPLLEWTARAALQAKSLDLVILSTDGPGIAAAGQACGLEVPFLRPEELAGDTVTDRPVMLHALDWLLENGNWEPEFLVLLRPTTPFKTAELIDAAVDRLRSSSADSLRTMTRSEGVFHPYWMYQQGPDGTMVPVVSGADPLKHARSQLLPPVWRLNGVVDVLRVACIRAGEGIYGSSMAMLEVPEHQAVDIDTEQDLRLCRALLSLGPEPH